MKRFLTVLSLIHTVLAADTICKAPCDNGKCVFNVNVELEAGHLGYFEFEECPGMYSPTIGIEIGQTYTFIQKETKNYFHPLGFAYYADGAHNNTDELEPGIAPYGTNSTCDKNLTCPSPMYFADGKYLGTYSNIAEVLNTTTGEDNFGLDSYEPLFFWPLTQWVEQGEFSVKLRFDNEDFKSDIFYFCHVHQYMTGRIKLLKNGVAVQDEDLPVIPYEYDTPSDYDQSCGTFGLENYQLPNSQCPERFVCDQPTDSNIQLYSNCNEAMNCHMFAGMTTKVSAQSEIALFIHQMIPHHENAINMAKTLLKLGNLSCEDPLEETPDCTMYGILLAIINGQNMQIQGMRSILDAMEYPATDDCTVEVADQM